MGNRKRAIIKMYLEGNNEKKISKYYQELSVHYIMKLLRKWKIKGNLKYKRK